MSLPGKQMGSLLNSYLLCISERVYRSSEQKSNLNNWYQKTNSSFIDSQNPLKKGSMNPLYKGLHHAPQILTVSLFPSPPQKDLWLLPGWLCFVGKKKSYFMKTTGHQLWADTDPRRSKSPWGPLVRGGACGGQVVNGLLAQSCPVVAPVNSQSHHWLFLQFWNTSLE